MASSSQPSRQFERLKQYMTQSSLTHTDEWLIACYEWLLESNSPSGMTEKFVQEQVYLQWLDVNLEEMESSCLPPQLNQGRSTVLNGIYALQVNSVQDIGESSYGQYNKIKKLESENTAVQATDSTDFIASWQPKPRRCLYLTMTDGSQKVYGLEVETIAALSLAMKPGCKVFIQGPVDCRRSVLHLQSKHIKPIGGEVEELAVPNSAENILCQILKKPTSTSRQSQRVASAPNNAQSQSQSNSNSASSSLCSFNSRVIQPIGTATAYRPIQLPPNNTGNDAHTGGSSVFDEEGDDFFMDIDEAALMASTPLTQRLAPTTPAIQLLPPPPTQPASIPLPSWSNSATKPVAKLPPLKRKPQSSSSSNSAPSGLSTSTGNSTSDSSGKGKKRVLGLLKKLQPPTATRTNSSKSNGGFNSSDDELFLLDETNLQRESENGRSRSVALNQVELITLDDEEDYEMSAVVQASKPMSNRCKIVSAAPYQYIKQFHTGQIKVGQIVSIKGVISTLTSNIQVDKTSGEWKLSANVNDGSGFLIARIAPLVLDGIIGFSPSQMKQMKASKSAADKTRVSDGLKKLTKTLVHFSGILRIQNGAEEKLITEMMAITADHIHSLVTRTSLFAS